MSVEPVRVLHMVGGMNIGGIESLIMNVYRRIDRSRVQFDFAATSEGPCHFDDEIRALGGRVFSLPVPRVSGARRFLADLRSTLREAGPFRAVHSHVFFLSGIVLKEARQAGVAVRIAHSHTTRDPRRASVSRSVYRAYMRALILRHATALLGCSQEACNALYGARACAAGRTTVLPNGIDTAQYLAITGSRGALRASLNLPDVPLIGLVGRFAEGKNHRFAVETFSIVNRERPDMHLVLVGDGPLLDETRQKVASLGLTAKTHFLGVRQEIPQIMFALDALMLPSVYEGFGIVSIEAQAAGTPCLASTAIPAEADVGDGLLDRIELACGPEVWATRMLQIMSRERTPLNLAATAVRAAGYDLSETVAQLTRLYLE